MTIVFSSTIVAKAWLATVAVILAVAQVLSGPRMYGKLGFIPGGPWLAPFHRWTGRIAFLFTLPVFFHCVTILGFETPDTPGRDPLAPGHVRVRRVRREGARRARPLPSGLGAAGRGSDDGLDARAPLADVEPLVLHERRVRVLMPRAWRPLIAGAVVVVAVFLLAQWPIFEPSTSDEPVLLGGAERGAVLFTESCAGCHGQGGTGGTGPALADSGLDADEISAAIEQGAGIMPAGIVSGQNQEDVVAYVVSIAG